MAKQTPPRAVISVGFPGLLTILFIGLKLTGNITWSWLWVLSPLWIGWASIAAFFAVAILIILIGQIVEAVTK